MIEAALFLYDYSGNAAMPWAEAGVECWCVDIQHSIRRERLDGNIRYVWGDARSFRRPSGRRFVFAASFSPCTHVAGSGARDFVIKGGFALRDALELFEAGRQVCSWTGAPYICENPVGVLSSIPHIGKPDHYFHPSDYAGWCEDDNYTKKTCLWTGNGFVMPPPKPAPWLGPPDDRIHKAAPGDDRANFRSASPLGFFRAAFHSNYPHSAAQEAIGAPS